MADVGDEMVQVPRREWEDLKAQVAELRRLGDRTADEPRTIGPRASEPPAQAIGGLTGRRGLLKHGAMYAAAAAAGATALVAQASPAGATSGTMVYGVNNNAGNDTTTLQSSGNPTLTVANTAGGISVLATDYGLGFGTPLEVAVNTHSNASPGVFVGASGVGDGIEVSSYGGPGSGVVATIEAGYGGTGNAVHGINNQATNTSPAVQADTVGVGPALAATITNPLNRASALRGATNGTGPAVDGQITNAANAAPALQGVTERCWLGHRRPGQQPVQHRGRIARRDQRNGTFGGSDRLRRRSGPQRCRLRRHRARHPRSDPQRRERAGWRLGLHQRHRTGGPGHRLGNGVGLNVSSTSGRGAVLAGARLRSNSSRRPRPPIRRPEGPATCSSTARPGSGCARSQEPRRPGSRSWSPDPSG